MGCVVIIFQNSFVKDDGSVLISFMHYNFFNLFFNYKNKIIRNIFIF
jgi:hypothetical protein